jgi:hypothetical protein
MVTKNNMLNGFDDVAIYQNLKKEIVRFANAFPY